MDEKYLEMAEDLAMRLIEDGINRARKTATIPVDFDGYCSCGEEIPPQRTALGFYNCMECQTAIERRGKYLTGK